MSIRHWARADFHGEQRWSPLSQGGLQSGQHGGGGTTQWMPPLQHVNPDAQAGDAIPRTLTAVKSSNRSIS